MDDFLLFLRNSPVKQYHVKETDLGGGKVCSPLGTRIGPTD